VGPILYILFRAFIEFDQGDLNFMLKKWFAKHKSTRRCAADVIKILYQENLNVRTFYKFNCSNTPDITKIDGGSYLHIGLSNQLVKLSVVAELPEVLNIDVNIDGCDGGSDAATIIPDPHGGEEEIRYFCYCYYCYSFWFLLALRENKHKYIIR